MLRPVWTEISESALSHNYNEIRKLLKPDCKILAVVKANGYGHGALRISRQLLRLGAEYLGVAIFQEAVALREDGIKAPILVLGYVPDEQIESAISHNITMTVFSLETARKISEAACRLHKKARIHIKIDTGMGRLGFVCREETISEVADIVQEIYNLPGIATEGIFMHFSKADESDRSYSEMQLKRFNLLLDRLAAFKISIPLIHAANSAAVMAFPEAHFNMVRPGIILYGQYPSHEVDRSQLDLIPVLQLKSRVAHVKTLPAGSCLSYGGTYITEKTSVIATLPLGYADGYSRRLSNCGHVLIGGRKMPLVGKVCMDQCLVLITDPEMIVKPGDEAIIIGQQKDEVISAEDIADLIGTICYEVLCGISDRVPRVYTD